MARRCASAHHLGTPLTRCSQPGAHFHLTKGGSGGKFAAGTWQQGVEVGPGAWRQWS